MSAAVLTPSILLFLVGIIFGCMPLIAAFRQFPRWIRFALHSAGAAFFIAAVLILARHTLAPVISQQLHRFIFSHIAFICGMGFGILFLLAVSGEYFKALRELDATRRKRLSEIHENPTTNTSNQTLQPTAGRRTERLKDEL